MAQRESKILGDKLSCTICLDLLKEPVTIPCGHNYCMNCITIYWDEEDQKHSHSCPQCRHTFVSRPVLVKNSMLAELVEGLKKTGLQAAPADHCYAGPGDVACDFCTGRKLKAIKSCLQCLVSFCEQHLQPHYSVAALKKHKLVSPSEILQENRCTNHNEVMKIFCHTDQQYICSDQHKDHCIVSTATEKNEWQKELKQYSEKNNQKTKVREEDVMLFQHRMEAINYSADESVRDSEKIFSELMMKRSAHFKKQNRSQQETNLYRIRELLQVQQELRELKRKDAELEELNVNEFKFVQMRKLMLHSDSESVDQPSASHDTWLRKPPSAGLKTSYARRAGGQETEDLCNSVETADPERAICSSPPTLLVPAIQRRHLRITPPLSLSVQRDTVSTIPSRSSPPTVIAPPIIAPPIIAPPIIAPPIIAPPISGHHMWINDLPIWSQSMRDIPFNPSPSIGLTVMNPILNPLPYRSTISKSVPRHY